MASTTFNGPVRSQNGFLEWNGSAWVPVGGGGGGSTLVYLNNASSPYGADNRYSDDSSLDPPTGPTAGNIIQLSEIDVGATYKIVNLGGGNSADCWALQLPSVPGTDLSAFSCNDLQSIQTYYSGSSYPVATENNSFLAFSQVFSPSDTIFIYGALAASVAFEITRYENLTVVGFGTIALFAPSSPAVFRYFNAAPDHFVYPYTQLIPGP